MIHKTIDGYETTVHPSMEQAAIDQGIRPAGYDAPITPIDGCCADKCKAFLDASYRKGCKDTVARFIEIIHRRQEEREALHDKGDWDNGYLTALEALECEAMVMEGTE